MTPSLKSMFPTYLKNETYVAVASQKHYIAVYICNFLVVEKFSKKHPNISCGRSCIRIKDNYEWPLSDLHAAIDECFNKA